jgi:hypothetical protein
MRENTGDLFKKIEDKPENKELLKREKVFDDFLDDLKPKYS